MRSVRRVLARSELHALIGLISLASFFWPIVALDRPDYVFCALFAAWSFAIVALFALSRVFDESADDEEPPSEEGDEGASDV